MPSWIQESLTRLTDFIPGLRHSSDKMAKPKAFKATDNFQHRYENTDILRTYLKELGFRDKDIVIHVSDSCGLEVQLPRELTVVSHITTILMCRGMGLIVATLERESRCSKTFRRGKRENSTGQCKEGRRKRLSGLLTPFEVVVVGRYQIAGCHLDRDALGIVRLEFILSPEV
jgi:hypothetical protein